MKYTQKQMDEQRNAKKAVLAKLAKCTENLENYKANFEALETKLADALKRYDEQRNAKKVVLEDLAHSKDSLKILHEERDILNEQISSQKSTMDAMEKESSEALAIVLVKLEKQELQLQKDLAKAREGG